MHRSFRRRLTALGRILDISRRVILNVLFWGLILVLLISALVPRRPPVPDGSLLVLSLQGRLVESETLPRRFGGIPLEGPGQEVTLDALTTLVDAAAEDRRIAGILLDLRGFAGGGPATVAEFAEALVEFRQSGKPVIVDADTYDNNRYRIAAAADRIVVDRLGDVLPTGYGSWRPYVADGFDRFGIDAEVFRSGESKSAPEMFMGNGPSDAALRDEMRLLGNLWDTWVADVASQRGLGEDVVRDWIGRYDEILVQYQGNAAQAALDARLVDAVETGGVVDDVVIRMLDREPARIDAADYRPKRGRRARRGAAVAVVPVVGTLILGPTAPGAAGSDDVVEAIRRAAADRDVAALVLRIDSPGGDVRAGEAIRRSLESVRREQGLPVVASFGNLAASGGYWIATESDIIVTRAETITGSIGVYTVSLRFERALEDLLGVRIDGFGTTPWSGAFHPGRSLSRRGATIYAQGVEDVDRLFRELVAESRDLDESELEAAAGGVPWSGRQALELKLADRVGGLDAAVHAAAELADLSDWHVRRFDRPVDPGAALIDRILWGRR